MNVIIPEFASKKSETLAFNFLGWIDDQVQQRTIPADKIDELYEGYTALATALQAIVDYQDTSTSTKQQAGLGLSKINTILNTHEAQDEFTRALQFLYSNGLTRYNTPAGYRPDDMITREQASKMYVEFMDLIDQDPVANQNNCNFTDTINADKTLRPYISRSCEYGLFQGFSGKFSPFDTLTRAQAIAVIIRALGVQVASSNPRFVSYIQEAAKRDIVSTSSTLGADNAITRRDVAIILYRAYLSR